MIESHVLGPKTGPERQAGYQTNFPPTMYVKTEPIKKGGVGDAMKNKDWVMEGILVWPSDH